MIDIYKVCAKCPALYECKTINKERCEHYNDIITALTAERDELKVEMGLTKQALRLHLKGGYCNKGDSHINCQFLPCGSDRCVSLHIKAMNNKKEQL